MIRMAEEPSFKMLGKALILFNINDSDWYGKKVSFFEYTNDNASGAH